MPERGFNPETWLFERIEIYKKFCLPSILNQSNKNFEWFFYIDSETPEKARTCLEKEFAPFPFIKLLAHHFDSFNITKQLKSDIDKYLGSDFDYLISSRVDTDDMLHMNYIKYVQNRFSGQDYEPLNFDRGVLYDLPTGVLSKTEHRSNAFLSLIEKRTENGFLTVFQKPHTEYLYDPKKVQIKTNHPMWCVTIHRFNDTTGFHGEVIKLSQPNMKESFGYNLQKKPSLIDILKFSIRSYKRTLIRIVFKLKSRPLLRCQVKSKSNNPSQS